LYILASASGQERARKHQMFSRHNYSPPPEKIKVPMACCVCLKQKTFCYDGLVYPDRL
jgi:hypothetical protein